MITTINNVLAQQIVNTIRDVCQHDINFISCAGIILASTNEARVGTYHEIGQRATRSGEALEVETDNSFTGTQKGINMPLFYEGRILAVIGITGEPEKVRKYAYLAERITNLLIREQELNQYSRRQADKMHFILQSLLWPDFDNSELLTALLKEFGIEIDTHKRVLLIKVNKRYNPVNLPMLEQRIEQMFVMADIPLHTFFYPGDYVAVIDEELYKKNEYMLRRFAKDNPQYLQIAIGRPAPLFQTHNSYDSAILALRTIEESEENYVVFDELHLELILSSVSEHNKKTFLEKTIQSLQDKEVDLLRIYFSEEMSLVRTSERLFLHKNTLQYKLNHIYEKTGLNPRKFQDAVLFYLAIRM